MMENNMQKKNNDDNAVDQLAKMLMDRMNESVTNAIAQPVNEIKEEQKTLEARMDKYEAGVTLESKEQGEIQRAVSDKVYCLLKDESPKGWKKYSGTFYRRLYTYIRRTFCIPSYRDIRKADFETAKEIIDNWEPRGGAQALKDEIDDRDGDDE